MCAEIGQAWLFSSNIGAMLNSAQFAPSVPEARMCLGNFLKTALLNWREGTAKLAHRFPKTQRIVVICFMDGQRRPSCSCPN